MKLSISCRLVGSYLCPERDFLVGAIIYMLARAAIMDTNNVDGEVGEG